MPDNRYVLADGPAILQLRKNQGLSQEKLAQKAGVGVDTVKNAEEGKSLQPRNLQSIAAALGVELPRILQSPTDSRRYNWAEVEAMVKKVNQDMAVKTMSLADMHVLAFPGPSLTFAGLLLASLPPRLAIRVPVHICRFAEPQAPPREGFHTVTTEPADPETAFTIFVPAAVTEDCQGDQKRTVMAIDDTIISGVTMRALRKFFRADGRLQIHFACAVCYAARIMVRGEVGPEFVGEVSPSPIFKLPWGPGPAFCFEEAMNLDTSQQELGLSG